MIIKYIVQSPSSGDLLWLYWHLNYQVCRLLTPENYGHIYEIYKSLQSELNGVRINIPSYRPGVIKTPIFTRPGSELGEGDYDMEEVDNMETETLLFWRNFHA